jgi:hypothetical protein
MKTTDVMSSLAKLGSAQTKKSYLRHGCPEPFFGVKVADMKALIRKFKMNQLSSSSEDWRLTPASVLTVLDNGRGGTAWCNAVNA